MKSVIITLLAFLASAGTGYTQQPPVLIYGNSSGTTVPVKVSSDGTVATSGAGGGGAGGTTQDTDDASIATGQSVDIVGGLTMVYDGSVWRRLTFGTAGTASTQVLTVQGIASMTALTTTNTGIGDTADAAATAGSTGSVNAKLRLATDLLNQINTSLSLGIPISNGSTTDTDDGTIAGGQSSVALTAAVPYGYDGTNNVRVRAKGSVPGSTEVGQVTRPFMPTDGTSSTIIDACESSTATISYVPVAITATSVLKTGTASKKIYVCSLFLMAAAAENFSIIEGTGSTCGTSTLAVIGSTTAAAGMNTAANGGFVLPASKSSWASTTVNANDLCLIKAGAVQVSGVLKVAVQ